MLTWLAPRALRCVFCVYHTGKSQPSGKLGEVGSAAPASIIGPADRNAAAINYDLDHLMIDGDKAMALVMIVNEAMTNAFKYAFRQGRPGRLDISLKEHGEAAVLTIRDNGDGYDPDGARKGTGSRLIRGFASQLEGEVVLRRDGGAVFQLTFLPGRVG
jgi:two-component sensor histidine kinase